MFSSQRYCLSVLTMSLLACAAGATAGAARAGQEAPSRKPLTLEDLARKAPTEGLKGTMHGVRPGAGYFVFTWWDPADFFRNVNFPLFSGSREVEDQLRALERHQAVTVKGRLVTREGQPPHLVAESVQPGEKWNPGFSATVPAEYPDDLRKELAGKRRIRALVHAMSEDASLLVVEYRGEVVPVQVPREEGVREQVRALYRGDRVELRFRIAEEPRHPLHLALLPRGRDGKGSLTVLDRIRDQHDRERTVEGRLTLFPKSPVLRRTIWGVEERGPDGLNRYFTIFNFSDLKDQDRTDVRLRAAWDAAEGPVIDGRNKYLRPGVRVRVSGKVNNPAANQANPALVTDSSRVEILGG